MHPIFVIMNDYFHDVATALPAATALVALLLERQARLAGVEAALARWYPALRRIAAGAAIWLVLGGIPRVLAFRQYEWGHYAEMGMTAGLVAKYCLMSAALLFAAWFWILRHSPVEEPASKRGASAA